MQEIAEPAVPNPTEITAMTQDVSLSRRSAFALLGVGAGVAGFAPMAIAQSAQGMAPGDGFLVVALWEVKDGQAGAVSDILRRYLPQAQADPGVKLFLIAQAKDKPGQFLFYELFADDAAYAVHQTRDYFKTLIVAQALPLLDRRERTLYAPF